MQIELKNIYYILVNFGIRQVKKIVVAKDKQEAIITINEYYDEPEVVCILSVQEMMDFLHLIEQKDNKLVFILEAKEENNIYNFYVHEETNPNKKEIEEKYKNKEYTVFTKDLLHESIKNILIDLPNAEQKMLLSDTYLNNIN